tara:strand:- start:63751 stop:63945 length:195 start_codon:yes stop_codon:yes gene_type:complete
MGKAYWDIAREGYADAKAEEPLFHDAHPAYAAGWCVFHDCKIPDENIAYQLGRNTTTTKGTGHE